MGRTRFPEMPSRPEPAVQEAAASPRNLVGLSGFVMSLVSLLTAGALSPFSLIVSLVGLSWVPRTFAALGVVISLLGCGLLAAVAVVVTVGLRDAKVALERKFEQAQNPNAVVPVAPGDQRKALDGLIDQLESLPPEERARLRKEMGQALDVREELLKEVQGVPKNGNPPAGPTTTEAPASGSQSR